MSRFPPPPEARLEQLLHEAFEFMPGPDMARLREVEQRVLRALPRRRQSAAAPWWLVLLLAGGAAAAAYVASEHFRPLERSTVRMHGPLQTEPATTAPAAAEPVPGPAPRSEPTRIIDKREAP